MLDLIARFGGAWDWTLAWLLVVLMLAWHRSLCRDVRVAGFLGDRVNRYRVGFLLLAAGLLINSIAYGLHRVSELPALPIVARALALPAMVAGAAMLLTAVEATLRDRLLVIASAAAVLALTLVLGLA